jgi:hypothetical protein
VADRVRQETYIIYPPLLFVMAAYLVMTFLIAQGVAKLEALVPQRR